MNDVTNRDILIGLARIEATLEAMKDLDLPRRVRNLERNQNYAAGLAVAVSGAVAWFASKIFPTILGGS